MLWRVVKVNPKMFLAGLLGPAENVPVCCPRFLTIVFSEGILFSSQVKRRLPMDLAFSVNFF